VSKRKVHLPTYLVCEFILAVTVFISAGRSSIRRDEVQQWKLVAGEMVDMLKMVRNEGNLGKAIKQ